MLQEERSRGSAERLTQELPTTTAATTKNIKVAGPLQTARTSESVVPRTAERASSDMCITMRRRSFAKPAMWPLCLQDWRAKTSIVEAARTSRCETDMKQKAPQLKGWQLRL